ncbi:MAG TPA: LodA/GoxA family CTQ-dependent oxidase [Candidatus Angelobacter sp.]
MGTPVYLGELRTDKQGRLIVLGGAVSRGLTTARAQSLLPTTKAGMTIFLTGP